MLWINKPDEKLEVKFTDSSVVHMYTKNYGGSSGIRPSINIIVISIINFVKWWKESILCDRLINQKKN